MSKEDFRTFLVNLNKNLCNIKGTHLRFSSSYSAVVIKIYWEFKIEKKCKS